MLPDFCIDRVEMSRPLYRTMCPERDPDTWLRRRRMESTRFFQGFLVSHLDGMLHSRLFSEA